MPLVVQRLYYNYCMTNLRDALLANSAAVEQALAETKLELAACEARCDELRSLIERAALVLELQDGAPPRWPQEPMTLHVAMEAVLADHEEGLRAADLADEINRRALYRKKGGKPVDAGQIHARVGQYRSMFDRSAGRIVLRASPA